MTAWVFVARAISRGTVQDEECARAIACLIAEDGRSVRLGGSAGLGEAKASILEENIRAVAGAAVLVAVLQEGSQTVSSVWLEIGMALAVSRPIVIVAPAGMELPFLILASASASPQRTVIVPAAPTTHETARAVLEAIRHFP